MFLSFPTDRLKRKLYLLTPQTDERDTDNSTSFINLAVTYAFSWRIRTRLSLGFLDSAHVTHTAISFLSKSNVKNKDAIGWDVSAVFLH